MLAHQDDGPVRPVGSSLGRSTRSTGAGASREPSGGPGGPPLPTIYVVHEDPAELEALAQLLRAPGVRVELCATIDDFLAHRRADVPGCVVIDARRSGRLALSLQALLRGRGVDVPVVCLTDRSDSSVVFRLLGDQEPGRAGPDRHDVLAERATSRLDERMRTGRPEPEADAFQRSFESLTTREREVAELVVSGKLNKQIAGQLEISIETVKVHRARAMRKMPVDSLAGLVRLWERYGPQIAWQPVEEAPSGAALR
jgi:FixJ family two-component response regulator